MMLFNWWGKSKQAPVPLAKAIDILGLSRVVSGHGSEALVPYSVKTLKNKAKANKKGALWYLVCVHNLSFLSLGKAVRPLSILEKEIIAQGTQGVSSPHYVLVDFRTRCKRWSWNQQERYLKRFPKLARIRSNVLAEVLHVVYQTHSKEFLRDTLHLGECKPIFYFDSGVFPQRIGLSEKGISCLMCLHVHRNSRTTNGCLIVIERPEVNL